MRAAEGGSETLLPRLERWRRVRAPRGEALLPAGRGRAMGIHPDLITAGVQTFQPAPLKPRGAPPRTPADDRKSA